METLKRVKENMMSKKDQQDKDKQELLNSVRDYYNKYHKGKNGITKDRIPYASRIYDEEEMVNLIDSSLEFWLTSGRYTLEFEQKMAEYLNIKFCSLVNSGSSANLLAFMTLTSPLLKERKINRGDEVITVAAGFPTTVTPIIQYGAVPVFLDVTIPQYNIDTNLLSDALSHKTKAVFVAHTLGNPFDLNEIKSFCDKNNLWLIEDNCDALGSTVTYKNKERFTGTVGDLGTSSFYPPHHMTMGEGGAVYTNNPLLHKIMLSLRDWGRDCMCPSGQDNLCGARFSRQFGELPLGYDHKYVYSHFGYNLKATDMQAAIGCAQLKKLPGFIEKRRENFARLYNNLKVISDKIILPESLDQSRPSWFGFLMTCKENLDRKKIVDHIENAQIQTRMLFAGNLIKHPCFDEMREEGVGYRVVGDLHNTNRIMNSSFWVGVYPGMTFDIIDHMSEVIIEAVNRQ
jgi:CDP-6-deoxy-D-xylo-4-hexulose-3-dehydrase